MEHFYANYLSITKPFKVCHPQLAIKHTGYNPSFIILKKAYYDAGNEWIECKYSLCSEIINHFFDDKNPEYAHDQFVMEGIKCFKFVIDNGYKYHYDASIDNTRMLQKVYTYDIFADVIHIINLLQKRGCIQKEVTKFIEYYFLVSGGEFVCDNKLITFILNIVLCSATFERKLISKKYALQVFTKIGFSFDYIYYDIVFSPRNIGGTADFYAELIELGISLNIKLAEKHIKILKYSFTRVGKLLKHDIFNSSILSASYFTDGDIDINTRVKAISNIMINFSEYTIRKYRANPTQLQDIMINIAKDRSHHITFDVYDHECHIADYCTVDFKNNPDTIQNDISIAIHNARVDGYIRSNDESYVVCQKYEQLLLSIIRLNIDLKPCIENQYLYTELMQSNIINYNEWKRYRLDIVKACKIKLSFIIKNKEADSSKIIINNISIMYDMIISYC